MRKVTKEIVEAFFARRSRKCGNTRTDGQTFYLHGNAIAKWRATFGGDDDLIITLAGWNTPTTRERLNGIGSRAGFGVYSHRRRPHLSLVERDQYQQFKGWHAHVEMPCNEWIEPKAFALKYGTDQ